MNKLTFVSFVSLLSLFVNQAQAMDEQPQKTPVQSKHPCKDSTIFSVQETAIVRNHTQEPVAVDLKGGYSAEGRYKLTFTPLQPNQSTVIHIQKNEPSQYSSLIFIAYMKDVKEDDLGNADCTKKIYITPTQETAVYKLEPNDHSNPPGELLATPIPQ